MTVIVIDTMAAIKPDAADVDSSPDNWDHLVETPDSAVALCGRYARDLPLIPPNAPFIVICPDCRAVAEAQGRLGEWL